MIMMGLTNIQKYALKPKIFLVEAIAEDQIPSGTSLQVPLCTLVFQLTSLRPFYILSEIYFAL